MILGADYRWILEAKQGSEGRELQNREEGRERGREGDGEMDESHKS